MNIQFKKGILELCVMAMLSKKDCYGYELVNQISMNIHISEGTIYPLLRRLKTEGYVTTYLAESSEGPPRKYYTLSLKGRNAYEQLKQEWLTFTKGIENLLREDLINE